MPATPEEGKSLWVAEFEKTIRPISSKVKNLDYFSAKNDRNIYSMRAVIVDPKKTEEFLLTQDGVEDASAWIDGPILRAHVTAVPGSTLDAVWLKKVCAAHIGTFQTPEEIILITARR